VLGNADFSAVSELCKAVLEGDSGAAFERTESFLSAGKSVGMLLKDIMNFLNACAVAKTCRDGKAILAFPDDMYNLIAAIAKATDGHRLLRVTEIFSSVEMELKFSTSPRILFETAVLKAAMPQADYDIEALIARISALEKQIAEGNFTVNVGGMSEVKAVTPPAPVQQEEVKAVEEEPALEDFYIPPDEGQTGGNAYFGGFEPQPAKVEKAEEKPAAPKPAKPAVQGDSRATFGTFLRTVRKVAKNGVLLTLCMDLDGEYEDGVFALYTTSDTIYRSLTKPEHYKLIAQTFETMGLQEGQFDIRLRGKQSDVFQKSVNEIKSTFEGVKVEIK
jgi:DNA polymerase III gamma/tau subunit